MDLFYRDFEASSPVRTGSQWLAALAARIAVTFVYALEHTDIQRRLLLTADQVWVLAVILAAWCGLSLFPATAGLAEVVNGLLFAMGALALFEEVKEMAQAGARAWPLAYSAQREADLEAAGRALAPALSGAVVTLLELLVTHAAFTAAEAAVLRRFPVPTWLEARFRQAATPKGTKPQAEPRTSDPRPRPAARGMRALEGAVQLEGARKTADVAQDAKVPGILVGGLAAVGVTAAVWALVSAAGRPGT